MKETGHYAVVVGINRYPGIGDLTRAKTDARNFCRWLTSPRGGRVPTENIEKRILRNKVDGAFKDPLKSTPTRSEIDLALRRVNRDVQEAVKNGDVAWEDTRLYLYVSGHGIAPSGGMGALLLATAARDEFDMTLDNVEIGLYRDWYAASTIFSEVVVFADCCRDHRPVTPAGGPPFDRPVNGSRPTRWAVGYATDLGAKAYEFLGDDGRGFYTRALIDGLKGGAADAVTGEITTETLREYVATSVEWQIKGRNLVQQPKLAVEQPIVLRPGLGPLERPKREMTISFLHDAPDECVLYKRGRPTEHRLRPGDGTVKLTLEEDLYQVRGPEGQILESLNEQGLFRVIADGRAVDL